MLGEHGCIVLQAGRRAALAVAAARGLWLRCHLATSYAQMRGAGWRVAIDTSSRCLRSAVGADGPWSCREWRSQERLSRLLQTSKKMARGRGRGDGPVLAAKSDANSHAPSPLRRFSFTPTPHTKVRLLVNFHLPPLVMNIIFIACIIRTALASVCGVISSDPNFHTLVAAHTACNSR